MTSFPRPKEKSAGSAMRAFVLPLLLALLVQVGVRGERGEWCTSSLASVTLTRTARGGDGDTSWQLWDFSVKGRLNSTSPATRGLFSKISPTRFSLTFRHAEPSEAVSGSLYLSNEQVPVSAVSAKTWNPRFHRFNTRPFGHGSFTGLFNLTSKRLCAKVCFRTENATDNYCGYLLSLEYPLKKTIDNLFVTGELRSVLTVTDINYVAPMRLVGVSRGGYTFTKLEEAEKACAASGRSLFSAVSPMDGNSSVCYIGLENIDLHITSNATCTQQACYPFTEDGVSGPRIVGFERLQCERDGRVHGFLLQDSNRFSSRFTGGPNAVAIEGKWLGDKLCMVGCKTSGQAQRDCSIQVTIQFPLEFSIHQRAPVIVKLSSQRQRTDALFFEPLTLGAESQMFRFYNRAPGNFTYSYSKTNEAEKSCSTGKAKEGEVYPSGDFFQDFFFSGGGGGGKQEFQGYPVSLDDKLSWYSSSAAGGVLAAPAEEALEAVKRKFNVSFDIRIGEAYIAAEGVYDSSRGTACMIGCQVVHKTSPHLEQGKDCKISIKVQYPPTGSLKDHQTTMTIMSLREKKDTLYFKPKTMSSFQPIYIDEASQSLWMRDVEVFLSMLTLSMVLIVLTFQLVHARRQPKLRPYTSLVMLSILVLGHMVPLVLNFEALFSKSPSADAPVVLSPTADGSFLQVKEVAIRLMNMAAFLLLLWLLHLVWNSRVSDDEETSTAELSTFGESSRLLDDGKSSPVEEEQKAPPPATYPVSAVREKNVLLVCMPLYVVGALATSIRQLILGRSLWSGLKAYAGLTLDFFLVPQVLAYFIWGVKVPALSPAFYVGMTVVRLLPHGFDIYRTLKPSFNRETDIFFANPDWDFFSLAWDIVIPCVAVLVAAVVCVQQRYGGRLSAERK